jgi:ABC-type transporter Mla MlaB component
VTTICEPITAGCAAQHHSIALTELVKGRELDALAQIAELARRQSIEINLASVQRIDAAGIAALVTLHSIARDAGHRFTVCHASARVVEVLSLVGLDQMLLSQNAVCNSHSGGQMERTAA